MKNIKSVLSVLMIAAALWLSTAPYAQGCDHDYDDDIETES